MTGNANKILVGISEREKPHFSVLDIDGDIILKCF